MGIPDIDSAVARFWDQNKSKIFDWYLEQKAADDIIISASPHFLLKPVAEALGVGRLIASEVDKITGRFYSPNCFGEEKVKRLKAILPDVECNRFYPDSLSDLPLARLARQSFTVKKGRCLPWDIDS